MNERARLRLGTACIEHATDLWPEGGAPDADWIRGHVDELLDVLALPLRHDGRDARRLPRRLHWLLWLPDDVLDN
ncbi:hypothetical protein SAMN02990966_06497 [Rhodospirillales bacterium URHD0017]|nr:hypothetical protein SAMN02990966_06497 [Rhodospirillales bacterium URHD0017]